MSRGRRPATARAWRRAADRYLESCDQQSRLPTVTGLALALGGSCILGQYSPDQVIVVFPAVTAREYLRRRLEEAVAASTEPWFRERIYRKLNAKLALFSGEQGM